MTSITSQLYNYLSYINDFTLLNEWKKPTQDQKITGISLIIFSLFLTCIYKLHKFYQSKKHNPQELKIQDTALNVINRNKIEVRPPPQAPLDLVTDPSKDVPKSESLYQKFMNEAITKEEFKANLLDNLIAALIKLGSPENIKQAEALGTLINDKNSSNITSENVLAILHFPQSNKSIWKQDLLVDLVKIEAFILFALMLEVDFTNTFAEDCFKRTPVDLRKNKEFCLLAMKLYPYNIFKCLDKELLNDLEVVTAYLNHAYIRETFADAKLKNDKSFLLQAMNMTKFPRWLLNSDYLPDAVVNDTEFATTVLKNNPHLSYSQNRTLKGNKAWLLEAFAIQGKYAPEVYKSLPDNLVADKDVFLACIKAAPDYLDYRTFKLKDDAFVLQMVKMNGLYLKFFHEDYFTNYEVVLAAVSQNGRAIMWASNELKANRNIALTALKSHPLAFKYISAKLKEEFKDDPEFIRAENISKNKEQMINLIKESFINFYYIAKELSEDPDILLTYLESYCDIKESVTASNWQILDCIPFHLLKDEKFLDRLSKIIDIDVICPYISYRYQKHPDPDPEIYFKGNAYVRSYLGATSIHKPLVLEAIALNPKIYRKATYLFRKDPEVALAALKLDRNLITALYPELYQNKSFLLEAIKLNKFCYYYISDELQKDPDLLSAFQS